jgi:hypothetical protein
MSALPPHIMERYVAYKESVLTHYNRLLEEHSLPGVRILIEALIDMESNHKEDVVKSNSMICPVSVDFSDHLELTPIDELHHVSSVFDRIIELKEKMLEEHFSNIIEHDSAKQHLEHIKSVEQDIHNQLKAEKSRYHI